ncbi:MAG: hypothetical protein OEV74_09060 [Cyclobacteriaceae bacterium]|nr:hypothetical protein [Cyclobacteriaceae bacterium]
MMDSFKREIFEQLGGLFYAIAKDQHVAPLEFGQLKMLLRNDWLEDLDQAATGTVTEASHLIVLAMDTFQTEGASGEETFKAFTEFYSNYRKYFPEALKEKIMRAALAITDIFPSETRLKNNHIIKLRLLFENSSLVV